jgi:hypothetical protein
MEKSTSVVRFQIILINGATKSQAAGVVDSHYCCLHFRAGQREP